MSVLLDRSNPDAMFARSLVTDWQRFDTNKVRNNWLLCPM